jgi:kynurenine formamidase
MTGDKSMVPDFPAGLFVVKGVLLDVKDSDIIDFNPLWGDAIHEGCAVLLYTGWSDYYGQVRYFSAHPVVCERFADLLAKKKIRILGIDAPSPDRAPHGVHKKLMSSGVFILENLTNLDRLLGARDFTLIAPPVKLDAEGAPVRAVALIEPRAQSRDRKL